MSKPFKSGLTDLAALKRTTDLVAVVAARGVKLKKLGNDYVGLCPFHREKTPSFHVTPGKNLFHCFGCGAAGSVIDFVMKRDGLTKQQAIDWLVQQSGGMVHRAQAGARPATPGTARPVNPAALLQRVVGFYARTLHKDRDGLDYLKSRKLDDGTMLEIFQAGYCNGTLRSVVPAAGELVEQLKALGVLNGRGQEHFRGCVTVPIHDATGNVAGIYGRRIAPGEPQHLYLPGPRRGVWNGACAKTNQTLFLVEAILDGLSLWQAGFKNVMALYGTNGWTGDHEALLRENQTREIYLCLDNDESGRKATGQLKEKVLPPLVQRVHVVQWPEGVKDANDFFFSRSAADFEALLKAANPQSQERREAPLGAGDACKIEMTPEGFTAIYGGRRYELRAIERPNAGRLKATVKAVAADRFHIDTVDFYLSRSRRAFIGEAARLFKEVADVVEMDANRLIGQLEHYASERQAAATVVLVPDMDKAEGLKLGRQPDLVEETLRDMERLGMIGESVNKLIGYLVMTSRKMDDPLALLILSGSGAGKSHLQDTILSLCPDEELIKLTSLTGQALFYKGEDSLRHKVLAVEEEAGASEAHYAIRNLISAKKLVIESTIKNALTGKLETQVNTVNGPTAVFQTTTNPQTDAETRSRFILVSVDESPEQTRAILQTQRQSHTLAGWQRRQQREAILRRHHAFQRLLKPVKVVNPFEPLLTYPDDRLLVRRDHPKYLNLILAVTFLHQLQRPIKHDEALGDYIETALEDVAAANDIAHQLFGHSLDDLSQPSRELLELVTEHVERRAAREKTDKITVTRRELREAFKWSDTRLRTHLEELVQMEYLLPLSGRFGQTFRYQLLHAPEPDETTGRFLPGLKSIEQLRKEANLAGVLPHLAGENGHLAPTSPVQNGEVKNGQKPREHRRRNAPAQNLAAAPGTHIRTNAGRSVANA